MDSALKTPIVAPKKIRRFSAHCSLESPYCSCVSVTLPASLNTRMIAQRERD